MDLKRKLTTRLMERRGGIIDIKESPEVLDEIVNEVVAHLEAEKFLPQSATSKGTPPFEVSWMDSWVAHHVFAERVADIQSKNRELASVLQGMVDLKFNARIAEIRELLGRRVSPPDGGTPEPGVPPPAGPAPAGPAPIFMEPPDAGAPKPGPPPPAGPTSAGRIFTEPPDAGPPEPGPPPEPPAGPESTGPVRGRPTIFTEPPDAGPPEPGVPPDPPAGPEPPAGPQGSRFGAFAENPWILYWFISLKTPMLLEVIDLHLSRRLESFQRLR